MIRKHAMKLVIAAIVLGFLSLGFLLLIIKESDIDVAVNGVVCNHSSADLWLAVTRRQRPRLYVLAPGHCTNFLTEDAEAIWGKECEVEPCKYQAWKLGIGVFDVYEPVHSPSSLVLRIRGLGAGSSWHITADWPKPELSSIKYSLVR
jgi:hypothetical protein